MIPDAYFVVLSVVLFVLGVAAFFVKKDLITQFLSIEVMLNAANLAFLALARRWNPADGQVIVFFVITVAAAEAVIGLAIILLIHRRRKTVRTADLGALRG